MADEKRNPDDEYVTVFLDWKESPWDVMEQVNAALAQRGIGATFHRWDDRCGDFSEYVLIKEGERTPSVEEWDRHAWPDDSVDDVLPGLRLVMS